MDNRRIIQFVREHFRYVASTWIATECFICSLFIASLHLVSFFFIFQCISDVRYLFFSHIFQWSADHLSVYSDSVVFQLYARSQREISSHAFKKSYPINWLLFLDIDIFVLAILLQFQVCNDDFFCSPQYFISVPYVCLVNFLRSICVFFYAENTSNFCVLIKKNRSNAMKKSYRFDRIFKIKAEK